MSNEALHQYEAAATQQNVKNQARRIRTRVTEARRNRHPAEFRWPFELLQNALDAGPRAGRSHVTVRFARADSLVSFEHDGALFKADELAALLSGGSSKEFESEITTGRFGTGFLVTHVLAEKTQLKGLLSLEGGVEQFELTLDRGGDEAAILSNIAACNEGIRLASKVRKSEGLPSATFSYVDTTSTSFAVGLDALRSSLPYLYATRPALGQISISVSKSECETWIASAADELDYLDGICEFRTITVQKNGKNEPDQRIYRFHAKGASASSMVLVQKSKAGWEVQLPNEDAPRLFREYPLRSSGFVPINFVIDGKFEPDQERARALMGATDKSNVEEALRSAVLAIRFAFDQKWDNAHLLARASVPKTVFDPSDAEEKAWWLQTLGAFAEQVARLPIVDCSGTMLPAIVDEGAFADFIVPRLSKKSSSDETTVQKVWPLIRGVTELFPPSQELAESWTAIASGWSDLGVDVGIVSISEVAEYARDKVQTLDQLKVRGEKAEWLGIFLDIVGECWRKRESVDTAVLDDILPNQNGLLRSPESLFLDKGISEALKAVADAIGMDVRNELLMLGFERIAAERDLPNIEYAIQHAVPRGKTEDDVLTQAAKYLDDALPEDMEAGGKSTALENASVEFLRYLWASKGPDGVAIARQLPFCALSGRIVRWSRERMLMVPPEAWHADARAFASAYPPGRVLSQMYMGSGEEGMIKGLVDWGIALPDPICVEAPAELKERRLAAIAIGNVDGVVVSRPSLSQIALLQPEVLNRCQEGVEEARALLGLMLCHVARNDPAWRSEHVVKGRKSGTEIEVRIRGALWLADLKFRAWVPVATEDGKVEKRPADATTLRDLLDPAWLAGNDAAIELLSNFFGFDELDLRLLGAAPNPGDRQELRNALARLVETGGANPAFYDAVQEEIAKRERQARDVNRCRRLGLAIQDAIKLAMEKYKLKLKLVDRGFDFDVTQAVSMEDAATKLAVGSFLLEIKATTIGPARLTPLQAKTASKEAKAYVLCVVDLRNVAQDILDSPWTAETVEPLAKIVSDIGGKVEETCVLVDAATTKSIGIKNEGALRYEVPSAVWETGQSINDWVADAFK